MDVIALAVYIFIRIYQLYALFGSMLKREKLRNEFFASSQILVIFGRKNVSLTISKATWKYNKKTAHCWCSHFLPTFRVKHFCYNKNIIRNLFRWRIHFWLCTWKSSDWKQLKMNKKIALSWLSKDWEMIEIKEIYVS